MTTSLVQVQKIALLSMIKPLAFAPVRSRGGGVLEQRALMNRLAGAESGLKEVLDGAELVQIAMSVILMPIQVHLLTPHVKVHVVVSCAS
jgi:hypothetical protein